MVLLGIVATLAGYVVNLAIYGLLEGRDKIYLLPSSPALQYVIWVVLPLPPAVVAAWSVAYLGPSAIGSGLPQMKALLSGVVEYDLLTLRTMVAKFVGVIAGHAAGLSIGREGPFVHMAAGIASHLMQSRMFAHLYAQPRIRLQLLSAAIAVGVTSTFGAPIGGVLFSVEVTAEYYRVSNLPHAFVASVTGVFFVWALGQIPRLSIYPNLSLFTRTATPIPYSWLEFVAFASLGLFSGLLGALYVTLTGAAIRFRDGSSLLSSHPYLLVCGGAVITAVISFPINQYFVGTEQVTINQLVTPESDLATSSSTSKLATSIVDLAVFVPVKYVLSLLAILLPVPAGTFTPVFTTGAGLGRLLGEALSKGWPSLGVHPAGYAIVGAAALTCGVTRSISTAIIALELTGQTHHLVPVFLAVTLAYAMGNVLSPSIYEVMHPRRGAPYLPAVLDEAECATRVATIMRTDLVYLTLDSSYLDILNVLYDNDYVAIPVLDSHTTRVFLGTVSRSVLEHALEAKSKTYVERRARWIDVAPPGGAPDVLNLSLNASADDESADMSPLRRALSRSLRDWKDGLLPRAPPVYWSRITKILTQETLRFLEGTLVAPDLDSFNLDEAPFLIVPQMSLERVDFLFRATVISHMWIVSRGELVGVITKKDLLFRAHHP